MSASHFSPYSYPQKQAIPGRLSLKIKIYTIDTNKLYIFKLKKCNPFLHRFAEKKKWKNTEKKLGERDICTNTHATYIHKTERKV